MAEETKRCGECAHWMTSFHGKSKRSRGRPLSKTTRAAIDLVHRYPHISPRELRRLVQRRLNVRVTPGQARQLKLRAKRILSRCENFVTGNFVTHEKELSKDADFSKSKPGLGFFQGQEQSSRSVVKEEPLQNSRMGCVGVTELGGGLPEANPTMFGLVVPAGVYGYVSSVWNLYGGRVSSSRNIWIEKFEGMRNQRDTWYCVFYDDFRMVLTCPSKKRDGDCLMFWRIHRVFSVEKYHECLRKVSDFMGRFGFEFKVDNVVPLMRSQYAVRGNPMLFESPFRATAPDGGFMIFDRSLGFSEYEFSSLEDALEYMRFRNGLNGWKSVREEVRDMKGLLKAAINALKNKGIIPSYGEGGVSG